MKKDFNSSRYAVAASPEALEKQKQVILSYYARKRKEKGLKDVPKSK